MATIHLSEADVLRDPAGLLAHARQGTEVIIETGATPLVLKPIPHFTGRSISEVIQRLEDRERALGHPIAIDGDFAADMEAIIAARKPRDVEWD